MMPQAARCLLAAAHRSMVKREVERSMGSIRNPGEGRGDHVHTQGAGETVGEGDPGHIGFDRRGRWLNIERETFYGVVDNQLFDWFSWIRSEEPG
jgi:hypothetical protein